MKVLNEMDNSSSEVVLLIITLFNTILSTITDQDTFYDMTDALEKQGMQRCTQFFLSKTSGEQELVEQFHIYDVSVAASTYVTQVRTSDDQMKCEPVNLKYNRSGC